MKSVALTIHFVHQAEIATLHRSLEEAVEFAQERKQYQPRMWQYITGFGWAEVVNVTEPEF